MRRHSPFEELDRLFDRMGRGGLDPDVSMHAFDVDVRDEGDRFVVTADLPGFEREDIDVSLSGRMLTIRAEHSEMEADDAAEYVRRERRHESASRSLQLPDEVDQEATEATYNNGVLAVTLYRSDAADDVRHIDVS